MDEPYRIPSEWPQAEALFRMQLVMPLLDPLSTDDERRAWRRLVLSRPHTLPNGRTCTISERTLRRWVYQADHAGLPGLERKPRQDRHTGRKVAPVMLARACALKREDAARSIRHIMQLIEQETGQPLPFTASTLWRHMRRRGLSRLVKKPKGNKKQGLRRFEAACPGDLWQCDTKYGPHLPDPDDPDRKRRVYLITFFDDFSRFAVHSEWFGAEDLFALELALQKALLRWGTPRRVYVDLGSIYQSPVFVRSCAALRIRHIPGSQSHPQGRGKLERFHRTIDDEFLLELRHEPVSTLEDLNRSYWAWLHEVYHARVHSQTKQSPLARFMQHGPLPPVDPAQLGELFLWEIERTVDNTGCIQFFGRLYQCESGLERQKVRVCYHPHRLERLRIWDRDKEKRFQDAVPMELATDKEPNTSRTAPVPPAPPAAMLERLVQQHAQRNRRRLSSLRLAQAQEDEADV